jgi:glycosyltransferase involved in cell wall biosynthesis
MLKVERLRCSQRSSKLKSKLKSIEILILYSLRDIIPNMKILFLYAELMPNLMPLFRALVGNYNAQIHVAHWVHKKKTPYTPDNIPGVYYYPKSDYGALRNSLSGLNPDLIYVSGWMDLDYLKVIIKYRQRGKPVVVGFDDWWVGSLKQHIGRIALILIRNNLFSHAWVSGPRQYEYAKRLGFRDKFIIHNLLSCDTELFSQAVNSLFLKEKNYPNIFLYVGRFSYEKGIELLVSAFEKYRDSYGGTWKLMCVGNGPLISLLQGRPNVEVYGFANQPDLVKIMERSGIFILPSLRDFSPLAVHEAACAGLPMILSSNVGSIPLFMIDNYNGIVFNFGSIDELAKAMHYLSLKSPKELILIGMRSNQLSKKVTPDICAASLVSVILRK